MTDVKEIRPRVKKLFTKLVLENPGVDTFDLQNLAFVREELHVLRGQITGINNQLESEIDRDNVKEYLEKVKILSFNYSKSLDQEEEICKQCKLEHTRDEKYSQTLRSLINKLEGILENNRQSELFGVENENEPHFSPSTEAINDRLLKRLKPFNGQPENFPVFWDTFRRVVDNTTNPSDEKMIILRSLLDDDTLSKLTPFSLDDYESAKRNLMERFFNFNRIKDEIERRIRTLPKVSLTTDTKVIDQNLTVLRNAEKAMRMAEAPYQYLSGPLLKKVAEKLPPSWIKEYEQHVRAKSYMQGSSRLQLYSAQGLMSFASTLFEEHCRHVSVFGNLGLPKEEKPQQIMNIKKTNNYKIGSSKKWTAPICYFCNKDHKSIFCKANIPVNDKWKIVKEKRLCRVCLTCNHVGSPCKSTYKCKKCNGNHSIQLCNKQNVNMVNEDEMNKENPDEEYWSPSDTEEDNYLFNIEENKVPASIRWSLHSSASPPPMVDMHVNNVPIRGQVDSGASCSVLSTKFCKKMGIKVERKEKLTFSDSSAVKSFYGTVHIPTKIGNEQDIVKYGVIDSETFGILVGRPEIKRFRLRINPDSSVVQLAKKPQLHKAILPVEGETGDKATDLLLSKHPEVFSKTRFDIGQLKSDVFQVKLTCQLPISLRPYRYPEVNRKVINDQVDELMKANLIKHSTSPYAFPVVLADKKGGEKRLCIDYRRLNDITEAENFPIPLIEDLQDRLLNKGVFSTLDLTSGFWQIAMKEEDRAKTAFVTQDGHYEWLVMPFGLRNAPIAFQRMIHHVIMRNHLQQVAFNYIDDILVFSENKHQHVVHLEAVFKALEKENIKLRLTKCQFFKNEVEYLGFHLSLNQVRPIHNNIKAITALEPPQNVDQLRSYLGRVNYYQRFFPNRAASWSILYDLLKKDEPYVWTKERQEAFENIKEYLTSDPVLHIFNPSRDTYLISDASRVGIGAVLKQKDENDVMVPIAYFSKRLTSYQKNYSVPELECLGIVEATEHWRHYLYGRKFFVITDHQPLQWLQRMKTPSARIWNWKIRLADFQMEILYMPGKENDEADLLSRNPVFFILTDEEIKKAQENSQNEMPSKCNLNNDKIIVHKSGDTTRVWLPDDTAAKVLLDIHLGRGHIGKKQMILHFIGKYYNKHLHEIAQEVEETCQTCLKVKQPKYTMGTLGQIGPAKQPFDIIHIDTTGGFAGYNSTKRYLHFAIDAFSRYIWGLSSSTQKASDFVRLIQLVMKMGKPHMVVADRYTGIRSGAFEKFLKHNDIKLVFTPIDHPQSNGMVERLNQSVVNRMRALAVDNHGTKQTWANLAEKAIEAYNKTVHTVTKFSPKYLITGEDPDGNNTKENLNINRQKAFDNSVAQHKYDKDRHDKRHEQPNVKVGEKVMLQSKSKINRKKLEPAYEGPYEVKAQLSSNMFQVRKGNKNEIVHAEKLKVVPAITKWTTVLAAMLFLIIPVFTQNEIYQPDRFKMTRQDVWETLDKVLKRQLIEKPYIHAIPMPFVALNTPHAIATGSNITGAIIEILPDGYPDEFNKYFMESVKRNCYTMTASSGWEQVLLEPRPKRQIVMASLAVAAVGAVIIGAAEEVIHKVDISMHHLDIKNQAVKELDKDVESLLKNATTAVKTLRKDSKKFTRDFMVATYQRLGLEFSELMQTQRLGSPPNPEILRQLFGIIIPKGEEVYTRVLSCHMRTDKNVVVLQIQRPILSERKQVVRIKPVDFYAWSNEDMMQCAYHHYYKQPVTMVMDHYDNCTYPLGETETPLYPTAYIDPNNDCENIWMNWTKGKCVKDLKVNKDLVTVIETQKILYVYCYPGSFELQKSNLTEFVQCHNALYEIPSVFRIQIHGVWYNSANKYDQISRKFQVFPAAMKLKTVYNFAQRQLNKDIINFQQLVPPLEAKVVQMDQTPNISTSSWRDYLPDFTKVKLPKIELPKIDLVQWKNKLLLILHLEKLPYVALGLAILVMFIILLPCIIWCCGCCIHCYRRGRMDSIHFTRTPNLFRMESILNFTQHFNHRFQRVCTTEI